MDTARSMQSTDGCMKRKQNTHITVSLPSLSLFLSLSLPSRSLFPLSLFPLSLSSLSLPLSLSPVLPVQDHHTFSHIWYQHRSLFLFSTSLLSSCLLSFLSLLPLLSHLSVLSLATHTNRHTVYLTLTPHSRSHSHSHSHTRLLITHTHTPTNTPTHTQFSFTCSTSSTQSSPTHWRNHTAAHSTRTPIRIAYTLEAFQTFHTHYKHLQEYSKHIPSLIHPKYIPHQ